MNAKKHIGKRKARVLLNLLSDLAVLVDEKGRFLVVNDVFEEVTGLNQKELVGKSFLELDIISAESNAVLLENLKKRLQGASVEPYEVYFIDKAGVKRCVEVKGKKVSYAGKPAVLVVFHNITRRKENQQRLKEYAEQIEALVNEKVKEIKENAQKLRESEEKYRTIFEEALDAIVIADAETGIIINCNRAASELVGREKSELIGKHQRILHPPEEIIGDFSRTFKQHLKEKEGQILETKVITKKGEIKDVAIKANIFEFQGKKCFKVYSETSQNRRKLRWR